MHKIKLKFAECSISISDKIDTQLMICSHERSGTHFLMNSIANSTEYTTEPFLDFDYHHLGTAVNFFSTQDLVIDLIFL